MHSSTRPHLKHIPAAIATLLALAATSATLNAATVKLGAILNPREAIAEMARPAANRSTAGEKHKLTIAGHTYATGVGTQANTDIAIAPNGATRFTALVGVDDASARSTGLIAGSGVGADVEKILMPAPVPAPADPGAIVMRAAVVVDGKTVWSNDTLRIGQPPVPVSVDIAPGAKEIHLLTEDTGHALSLAHVNWVDAAFTYEGERPAAIEWARPANASTAAPAAILTPKPAPRPRITSARVFGARPGHPFLYNITATGQRPMRFSADNLPDGLALDPATGRITGALAKAGTFTVTLRATNTLGSDTRPLRIEIGDTISLTPALGWNSWNCWARAVDQDKILRSARAMASSGLADHGWTYINIDDAWQAPRAGPFNALQPNEKFPDMPGLAAAVHDLGLKLGIYSTPWRTSYAGYPGGSSNSAGGAWEQAAFTGDPKTANKKFHDIGAHSFATNDAKQWAAWGIDYLKYDWNPNQLPETADMFNALRASGRDITLSLSNNMPFENVAALSQVSNSWRTTGDIRDTWGSLMHIGFTQSRWRPHARPGHWNDVDMLVVGYVGWGPTLRPTRLTPDEQYTHITLWSLLSAPLLIGCDLERLDDFTLNLLTNDEVLDVDQDPRGDQAAQVYVDGRRQVWIKTMEDGSRALGIFNLSPTPDTITVTWPQLGLPAARPQRIRDLWRQQDLPDAKRNATGLSFTVPAHGCYLLRVW